MSGEAGGRGYEFQCNVILAAALEAWAQPGTSDVATLLIEGGQDQDSVDYTVVSVDGSHRVLTQVRSRWNLRTLSAREIVAAVSKMAASTDDQNCRLEFATNGRLGPTALRLVELLGQADSLTAEEIAQELESDVGELASLEVACALKRTVITIRPATMRELRDSLAIGIRKLRGYSDIPVGWVAAELLRSRVLELLRSKTDSPNSDRQLTREEFLEAACTPQRALEEARGERWGVPVAVSNQESSVRRHELLEALGRAVQDEYGLHASDGIVRHCVLTGGAGVGKTTLAQHYALSHAGEFDWIYQLSAPEFIDGANPDELLRQAFARFATWLSERGLDIQASAATSGAEEIALAVQQALASWPRAWLLILDNVTDFRLVAHYLPATGYGVVVSTSRNSGWVGPCQSVPVGTMTAGEATEVLARRLHANGQATDGNEIAQLCEQLGFLPIGLSTAAAFLTRTREPLTRFLVRLKDETRRVAILSSSHGLPNDYPQTAAAVIRMSVRYISEQAATDTSSQRAIDALNRASLVAGNQIPPRLLESDEFHFSEAVALLTEMSLLDRWQDEHDADWVRIHSLVQDVVRVDMGNEPGHREQVLRNIQAFLTELMHHCAVTRNFALGSVLREHGSVVLKHVFNYRLASWSDTVALHANTAVFSHAAGNTADAEALLRRALDIIPTSERGRKVDYRRAKTLIALGRILINTWPRREAREMLIKARDLAYEYREHPAHREILHEAQSSLLSLSACETTDQDALQSLYQQAMQLPTYTDKLRLLAFEARENIAVRLDWTPGAARTELRNTAEATIEDNARSEHPDPVQHAEAHLLLAEAHASSGQGEAAWAHYCHARDTLAGTQRVNNLFLLKVTLNLAWALCPLVADDETGQTIREIDDQLVRLLAEADSQLVLCESEQTIPGCDVERLRYSLLRLMRASYLGEVHRIDSLSEQLRRDAQNSRDPIPEFLTLCLNNIGNFRLAAIQAAELRADSGVSDSGATSQYSPTDGPETACEHVAQGLFDPPQFAQGELWINPRSEPLLDSNEATEWEAAVYHAEVFRSWVHSDYAALEAATAAAWEDQLLLEMQLTGATQILSVLLDRITNFPDSRITRSEACDILAEKLDSLPKQGIANTRNVRRIVTALSNGDLLLTDLESPGSISDVRELLQSLFALEFLLLRAIADSSDEDVRSVVDRVCAAANFEASRSRNHDGAS